jgi:hypothetical protein
MATRSTATSTIDRADVPQQLTLLPVSPLPVQFRLDRRTRERGLAHIAEIRRQLAANASRRATSDDRRAA